MIPYKGGYAMHAIRAIYDGTSFRPMQPITVTEQYEVIITFVEPIKEATATGLPNKRGCMKGKMWISDDFDKPLCHCGLSTTE